MRGGPSVFSTQTVCFSFIRIVCISVLHYQSRKCRFPFASFHSFQCWCGNIAFSLCI